MVHSYCIDACIGAHNMRAWIINLRIIVVNLIAVVATIWLPNAFNIELLLVAKHLTSYLNHFSKTGKLRETC